MNETELENGLELIEYDGGKCEIVLERDVVAWWVPTNTVRTKEKWMADVRRHRKQTVKCFESCERIGHICAGCSADYVCDMPRETARWLFKEFLPAIDPSGQVFGVC